MSEIKLALLEEEFSKCNLGEYTKKNAFTLIYEFKLLQQENKNLSLLLIDYQDMEQRLNDYDNILNKLESWLEEEINTITNYYSQINGNYMRMQPILDTYKDVLDKLKELRGKNNG